MRVFQTKNIWKLTTFSFLIFFYGCLPLAVGYVVGQGEKTSVHINGFLDTSHQFTRQRIYVLKNPNPRNHILENEVTRKITNGLKAKGFEVTNSISEADYILTFLYGRNSEQKIDTETNTYKVNNTYVSETNLVTEYIHFMRMDLYPTNHVLVMSNISLDNLKNENIRPVWIGEAQSFVETLNPRKSVDPLIVVSLNYFLKNIEDEDRIHPSDKRIKSLYQEAKK